MEPLTLRVGRKQGRTLYQVNPDGSEQLIGLVDTRELAAAIADAVNTARPIGHHPPPGPQDLPTDQLLALMRGSHQGAEHPADGLGDCCWTSYHRRALVDAYRVGYAAALGYHITVNDTGDRVRIGDRPRASGGPYTGPPIPLTPGCVLPPGCPAR